LHIIYIRRWNTGHSCFNILYLYYYILTVHVKSKIFQSLLRHSAIFFFQIWLIACILGGVVRFKRVQSSIIYIRPLRLTEICSCSNNYATASRRAPVRQVSSVYNIFYSVMTTYSGSMHLYYIIIYYMVYTIYIIYWLYICAYYIELDLSCSIVCETIRRQCK